MELSEIDRLFTKAEMILKEARSRLEAIDYDLIVRRAQESLEAPLNAVYEAAG